jgi:hypothetical protein
MLPSINPKRKTGNELFLYNGSQKGKNSLLDFWVWSSSVLVSNATRGVLAEFIVAMSLGQTRRVRMEWEAYDLEYNGIKIEVKSAAFIQSWNQKKFSKIQFSIKKTRAWDYESNKQAVDPKRQADVYVFALLHHKDQKTINPLDLNQWSFYVLSSKTLDEKVFSLKTIGIKRLESLGPRKCTYPRLKRYILEAAD